METKLTIRVPRRLVENAKRYPRSHNTTLTALVSAYLEQIESEAGALDEAPIVRRLTGVLSPEGSREDYHRHLDEKYGKH